MLTHEKFDIFNEIVSSIPDEISLTYSPLIREGFHFCLKHVDRKDTVPFKGEISLSGVSSTSYPRKRSIEKVGFFYDQEFLQNILFAFSREGLEIEQLKLLHPRMKKVLSNKQKEEISYFDSKLKEGFGISIRDALVERFHLMNGMVAGYYELLKASGVDALVLRVYYGLYYFPIILACKMLGITVIDVQHGMNGLRHPCYSKFNKNEIDSPLLPDVFWTWSDMATRMLKKDSAIGSGVHIVEGGNPKFGKKIKPGKKDSILYTHQPQSKGVRVPYEEIKKVFEIQKEIVAVRPHPLHVAEAKDIQNNLRHMGVKSNLIDPEKETIHESLSKASVHVTNYSTCALDALNFGVPTVYCSEFIRDIEREFSTGLLFDVNELSGKKIERMPERAIDYSIGSKEKIRKGVKELLSLPSGGKV
ncbi:hypothetical protein P3W43_00500 [Salinicola salarius]|uniref:hypothetical protein n=1 Tax=Salinicola salarius TaxID=430457 RepID=UPI0023E39ECF|nr:hypothetical protein [Salinicola salarius]MDF3917327.1 hypothetical protein [Salinicola salarius]